MTWHELGVGVIAPQEWAHDIWKRRQCKPTPLAFFWQRHDLPKTVEDMSPLDACAKDMGNTIKHTNYANTGTQFTIQDASNFKCSTFKEVSAKLQELDVQ